MLDGTEYFECQCGSDEHTLKFILDLDENAEPRIPELYTSVFLNHYQTWYKRLWVGIKYIFGYKSKYGHWDCFTMKHEDADRLINMVTRFKDARD